MEQRPQNRRVHPRFDTSLSVEVYTSNNDVVAAVVKNLSQGGVGIAVEEPLPAQAQVGLSMFLTEEGIEDERTDPLNVRGQIIWCTAEGTGFLCGVRFFPLQPQELQRLELFLRRLHG